PDNARYQDAMKFSAGPYCSQAGCILSFPKVSISKFLISNFSFGVSFFRTLGFQLFSVSAFQRVRMVRSGRGAAPVASMTVIWATARIFVAAEVFEVAKSANIT